MNMYTAIHNFCVSTHPQPSQKTQNSRAGRGNHTKLLGGELYSRLVFYLKEHLTSLYEAAPRPRPDIPAEVAHNEIISYYNSCWSRFLTGARYLDHIFSYLNRHWVKQERDEGGRKRGVYEVNTLCLVLWRDHMFLPLDELLINAVLSTIERDRNGQDVDYAGLHTCIQSMVSVGFDDQNSKRTNLLFYSEHFEKPFTQATAAYYKAESQKVLREQGVVSYMRRVNQRLMEERNRVSKYLHPSTEELLMSECEKLLIEAHELQIQSEFLGLLSADNRQDLHIMYTLLRKVPNGLAPIRDKLEMFVQNLGLKRITQMVNAAGNEPIEPRSYVEGLLDVCSYFESLLETSFEKWPTMKSAVDNGCAKFINSNQIAKPSPNADSKTPELLSRFADSLLKRSSRYTDISQIEEGLDGVLRLLQYTEEKDVFEKHYTRMLSRRLVHQTSSNADLESKMVTRLGDICGFEYTNKLQRMFQDVATSQQLQAQFKDSEGTALANSFAPFVLAEGFWPLPHRVIPDFKLPSKMEGTFQRFVEFYDKVHNGRKLKWLWNFGKGEMKLNMPNGKVVLLQVSIYQMMILLAFNDADSLTKEQLYNDVQLPAELLDGSLGFILKSGILLENPVNVYSFNPDFKSKRMRINLNLPLKADQRQEASETEKQIEEQRQSFLQAIIVRIMKARKHSGHAHLIEEVMMQARARFNPSVKDVKRALNALLEREYLKRSSDNAEEYEYAA